VQTCIWPSWCHCHSLSLASVKSRLVLPFWYRLTWVVPEKGPLNGRVCVCVCVSSIFLAVARRHWKQEALLPQTDRATRYVSQNLANCTTNPQEIAVMELEGYSRPTCGKQPRLVDCCVGVTRPSTTTRFVDNESTFLSTEFRTNSQREVP